MTHPVYPATVGTPDPVSGTVTVTIGEHPPVVIPWRGNEVTAINEVLNLLESEPHVAGEGRYPFVTLKDVLGELTPESRSR